LPRNHRSRFDDRAEHGDHRGLDLLARVTFEDRERSRDRLERGKAAGLWFVAQTVLAGAERRRPWFRCRGLRAVRQPRDGVQRCAATTLSLLEPLRRD
jgi:hypothetical protein